MNAGRCFIAPSEGCIPEEVGDARFLYDLESEKGLEDSLKYVLNHRHQLPPLGKAARQGAEMASPAEIASEIIQAYESVLSL